MSLKRRQLILSHFFRFIFGFFLHLRIQKSPNVSEVKPPLIIAPNHLSFLDSLIIGAVTVDLPDVYPMHFMVKETIMRQPILGSLLRFIGGVAIKREVGLKESLGGFEKVLHNEESLVVFPEGVRSRDGNVSQVKRGITHLLWRAKETLVLPIGMHGQMQTTVLDFLLRRRKVNVVFGEPVHILSLMENPKDFKGGAEIVQKILVDLAEKAKSNI